MKREITDEKVRKFRNHLMKAEKSPATVEKYVRDIVELKLWLGDRQATFDTIREWKNDLIKKGFSSSTINTKICALNSFAASMGWQDLRLKALRIQRRMFRDTQRELTRSEYERLIKSVEERGDRKLALLMETIGATGMRVSEIQYLTIEAVRDGKVEISLKGKIRTIVLPAKLQRKLREYAKEESIKEGVIFRTHTGKPIGRKQIWAKMKEAAAKAGIEPGKVFPHNMRHLFARVYYKATRNLAELASLLGHSSMETTRIYLLTTEESHQRMLNGLHLVC